MRRAGYRAHTIHEVQGKTFDHVVLVRLNRENMRIYRSLPHILVGMTRHIDTFVYYSATNDIITNAIEKGTEIKPPTLTLDTDYETEEPIILAD